MIEKEPTPENINRDVLISRLTATDTPLEEKILLTREIFPEKRKREILTSADTDKKGRPVRYFRLISYEELRAILNHPENKALENPRAAELFQNNSKRIKNALKSFLEQEDIYKQLEADFIALSENFSLDNYQNFVQRKLPRIKLFKLHIGAGGDFPGLTGLNSVSVGAPYQPPYNPAETRADDKEGLPVVEFSIPSDDILVHPLFKTMNIEMEKEVNTLDLRPEWVVDIYNGTEDFSERFIKDPQSVLNPQYEARKKELIMDYIGEGNIWDILQNWKHKESIADLIPANKIDEIDENNPALQRPLCEK